VGALVLPPFFWKDPTDEGLYATYAALIDGVADARLRLYLYHIPQVTAIPIPASVIARLLASFPRIVVGLKDSAGDLDHSIATCTRFPALSVFVGHEPHLPAMLAAGGAGTICGLANFFPRLMRDLLDGAGTARGDAALATIRRFLEVALDYPLMPAFKALEAQLTADDGWIATRLPLVPLGARERQAMLERLRATDALAT
jgi:4-hydroxy-tetrahydrodipicolinate synthase